MDRQSLLRTVAETGYNVGFGAKKNFATFDIVEKVPGWVGFISLSIGILSLVFDSLSAKLPSACLAVAGVAALYISLYNHEKPRYEQAGKEMTRIYNELRRLYRGIKSGDDPIAGEAELRRLEAEFYTASISKQILLSDWYAHYKFFAQMQIEWIDEQKRFTWRDKVPLSLITCLIALGIGLTVGGIALVANLDGLGFG